MFGLKSPVNYPLHEDCMRDLMCPNAYPIVPKDRRSVRRLHLRDFRSSFSYEKEFDAVEFGKEADGHYCLTMCLDRHRVKTRNPPTIRPEHSVLPPHRSHVAKRLVIEGEEEVEPKSAELRERRSGLREDTTRI